MAQFVVQQQGRFVPQAVQQPVIFQSQVVGRPPVVIQPLQVQQQVVEQPETQSLLRKESTLTLRLKQFLFYSPVVFFFLLLVFSSVIYGLRFQHSNATTPAAVQTLVNYGNSLNSNPILELRVLPKYRLDDTTGQSLRNTCADLETVKGTPGANFWDNYNSSSLTQAGTPETKQVLDRFEEVVFNSFSPIRDGCVCAVQKYGKSRLTYHDADYCESRPNCQVVRQNDAVDENIVLGSLFCVRRAAGFVWKASTDKCEDLKFNGTNMRECGPNFCVSTEEGLYGNGTYQYQKSNLCPISRIEFVSRTQTCQGNRSGDNCLIPAEANRNSRDGDNTREIIHFRNRHAHEQLNLQIVTYRQYTSRPVIDLHTSISSPQCLAGDLQRPLRTSHNYFKFQQPRESGCWPYGAHLDNAVNDIAATYQNVYSGISQEQDLADNDVILSNVPYYKEYIVNNQDLVNVYAEVRPRTDQTYNLVDRKESLCRQNGVQQVADRARHLVTILNLVENYSFAFIITGALGLVASVVLLVLRSKSFVNQATQLYLHLFLAANAVALFVYAVSFFALTGTYNTSGIESQLSYQYENECYSYNGQVDASRHLFELTRTTNTSILGLTSFLFVVDVLYLLGALAAVVVRRRERLNVFEPVKQETLYYE